MKKILTVLVLAFVLANGVMYGQAPALEIPYIEVQGFAEKEIDPNEIFIQIVIQERIQGKDKVTVQEQEEKLISGLKKIGFPMDQLTLADANAYYQNQKWRNNEVISTKQYELKASNAQMTSSVFKLLDEILITNAYITRVHHSKMEDFKNELRTAAMKSAKSKAHFMLDAIEHKVGKALIVREQEQHYPMQHKMAIMTESRAFDGAEYDAAGEVDFRKIKLQMTVYVKFEIKETEKPGK
jgi:uncharacterized protein